MLHKTFRTGAGPGAKPEGERRSGRRRCSTSATRATRRSRRTRAASSTPTGLRRQWDMTGFLMLIFVALVTPFEIAFVGGDRLDALKLVNWVATCTSSSTSSSTSTRATSTTRTGWGDAPRLDRGAVHEELVRGRRRRREPRTARALSESPRFRNRSRILGRLTRARANFPFSLVRRFWIDLISVVPYDEILWLMTYNERRRPTTTRSTTGPRATTASSRRARRRRRQRRQRRERARGLLKLVRPRGCSLMRVLRANRIMQRWATRISLSFCMQAPGLGPHAGS